MVSEYDEKNCNYQRTLLKEVSCIGVGLHSGLPVELRLRPSAPNTGIRLRRTDILGSPLIPASSQHVVSTQLATTIGLSKEISVSTVEHLFGALFGFGIDNVIIEVNSHEIPIMDGSALPFLVLLDEAGIDIQKTPKKAFVIKQAVEIVDPRDPQSFIRVEPSSSPWISYSINFEKTSCIGLQSLSIPLTGESFCNEVSMARTFCHSKDVEQMLRLGLAKGGNYNNAIVVGDNGQVINPDGLRSSQEFVKHKILDCIGDLYLLGMPVIGHILASKAGHSLHTQLVKKLTETLEIHSIVELASDTPYSGNVSPIIEKLKFPLTFPTFKTTY